VETLVLPFSVMSLNRFTRTVQIFFKGTENVKQFNFRHGNSAACFHFDGDSH